MPARTTSLRIAIIGAGRVGSALALTFRKRKKSVVAVVSRTKASARRLARAVRSRHALLAVSELPASVNCIVIATPDELIAPVAAEIAAHPELDFENLIVFHTSGPLTSDLLLPLTQKRARAFSLHPIQTFPTRIATAGGTRYVDNIWYGYEGPARHRKVAQDIVKALGGRIVSVPKEKKILYHLACVFASNYTTVLLGAAESLACQAGMNSLEPLRNLVETSMRNALEQGPGAALTGPLVRGSEKIVQQHLSNLAVQRPDLLSIYSALALFGLTIAAEEGRLSEEDLKRMTEALTGIS